MEMILANIEEIINNCDTCSEAWLGLLSHKQGTMCVNYQLPGNQVEMRIVKGEFVRREYGPNEGYILKEQFLNTLATDLSDDQVVVRGYEVRMTSTAFGWMIPKWFSNVDEAIEYIHNSIEDMKQKHLPDPTSL